MYSQLTFSDQDTPRKILEDFYRNYNLGQDGGVKDPYVRIEFLKNLSIYFPNFEARKRAVLKHDIHHLATGYTSALKGETEISAWELASGCTNYFAAFVINLHGMMLGVPLNIKGIFGAFVRGRRTRNLYDNLLANDAVLDMPVAEIRKRLKLDVYDVNTKAGFADYASFAGMVFIGGINSLLSLLLLPVVVFSTLNVLIFPYKLKRNTIPVAE